MGGLSDPGQLGPGWVAKPDTRKEGRWEVCAQPAPILEGGGAGAHSGLRMPGEAEEQAFLEAREELARALRRDSGQAFSLEQLWPLLVTSLPPAARYLQLDAARLVRCNAHGEVRPGPARKRDVGPDVRAGLTALLSASSPETTSTPCPRP